MSSSSLSISSTPDSPTSSTSSKSKLLIKLKISPESLKQFPHDTPPTSISTPSKPASVADDDKTPLGATSPATAASPVPTPSVASPAPTGPGSPPNLEGKAVNGVVEAVKRGGKRAGGGGGKPGPKKRKLDDGSSLPPSRLGPKASGGAINAGLRSLDRSGNPCKKWSKTPLTLKSFTGFKFTLRVYETRNEPNPETTNGVAVSISDAASVVSGGSNDVNDMGTPKEAEPNSGPMEDVQSTNGDETPKVNGVDAPNGVNGVNGVHTPASESVLVPPV
ncbi:hypothetical protein ABW19_dt0208267 [Dactylella cylindrospora]|nr:hypothetical protein ABW19_dt0208267 [Dactylella cylindrospora]